MDSMSPTVPPISTMVTSTPGSSPTLKMRLLISSVMWGMTWTVRPRNWPSRSLRITSWYTCPVVTEFARPSGQEVKRE
jgi:hypothetical protein